MQDDNRFSHDLLCTEFHWWRLCRTILNIPFQQKDQKQRTALRKKGSFSISPLNKESWAVAVLTAEEQFTQPGHRVRTGDCVRAVCIRRWLPGAVATPGLLWVPVFTEGIVFASSDGCNNNWLKSLDKIFYTVIRYTPRPVMSSIQICESLYSDRMDSSWIHLSGEVKWKYHL